MAADKRKFRSIPREDRRYRILYAAKQVFIEKGWEATSMDDVAARAGTTKPTVYAHFKAKAELFAAVGALIRELMLGQLKDPGTFAAAPVEAITQFCGRYVGLVTWRDPVALQRAALAAAAAGETAVAVSVHDAVYAQAARCLSAYLSDRRLTRTPDATAELLLAATTAGPALRHLFAVDESPVDFPDVTAIGNRIDLAKIRKIVRLLVPES